MKKKTTLKSKNQKPIISEYDEWRMAFQYLAKKIKNSKSASKSEVSDAEKAKRKKYQADYRKRKKEELQAHIANIRRVRDEDSYKNTHGGIDYEHQIYAFINNKSDDVLLFEKKQELLKLVNEQKFELLPAGIKRRVVLKIATPPWTDKEKIRALYLERDRRNQHETDDPWEVDHYYPILGKMVTGLHSHQNLVLIKVFAYKD